MDYYQNMIQATNEKKLLYATQWHPSDQNGKGPRRRGSRSYAGKPELIRRGPRRYVSTMADCASGGPPLKQRDALRHGEQQL